MSTTGSATTAVPVYSDSHNVASHSGRTASSGVNEQSSKQNSKSTASFQIEQDPHTSTILKSNTIAPSPPPSTPNGLPPLDPASCLRNSEATPQSSPLSARLRIQTDMIPNCTITAASTKNTARNSSDSQRITLARTHSIKNILASSVGSNSGFGSAPDSALSSPMISAMADVTPLPSPLMSGDSPGPWKRLGPRPVSREVMMPISADSALVTANGESISMAIANQSKRRAYHGLLNTNESALTSAQVNKEKNAEGHSRNRSVSEYIPDATVMPKTRHITVSGSHAQVLDVGVKPVGPDSHMRREPNLAVQRGLAPAPRPPTPPPSRAGGESSDSDSSLSKAALTRAHKKPRYEYFDAHSRVDSKRRRWRGLKVLGQGTFSKVMLATSQMPEPENRTDENGVSGVQAMDGTISPIEEPKLDRRKLVAIKICEHGPKGGASEERVEMSLKRELEIMKSINHPSLVHLKAWNIEQTRAILVLSYCPGGDLFDLASQHRSLLVPGLLQRMFAELIGAVQYLHERHIVHRDIKLENVLVNLPQAELSRPQNWSTYPNPIITLTDLGLSRRVADDEKLTTRCGSDDYAAPEVIMGQPYDGRATDAWSLGVLLYALLESRLPFDPNPGMVEGHKQRSRTSHRIARVEWRWIEFGGEEGEHEHDPEKFRKAGLDGARIVTEALLKRARSRWSLEKVGEAEWVKEGIMVEGGVRFREEDNPEEVIDEDEGL